MNKIIKKLPYIVSTIFCVIFLCTTMVYASSTLMTYKGTGIRDKNSTQSFHLATKTTIVVSHTTDKFEKKIPAMCGVKISLLRKNGFSYYRTGDSFSVEGIGSDTHKWKKDAGDYKLHFQTYGAYQGYWVAANIHGTVKKN